MEAKRFLYTLMRFVVRPVTVQPVFFLLLYILLNVLDIYSIAIFHSFSPLFKVISGFFFCYIFALPVMLMFEYIHVYDTQYQELFLIKFLQLSFRIFPLSIIL